MIYRCLLALMLCCAVVHAEKPSADLILTNGKIWTVDSKIPEAQALAVIGKRIIAVGTNAEIESLKGPHTKVIDLNFRSLHLYQLQ